MSDFLLDLRPPGSRRLNRAAERLRFTDATKTHLTDTPAFGLVTTHVGDAVLWAPFHAGDGSLVAVAGRPVFDQSEWDAVGTTEGRGGLASRIVYRGVRDAGAAALERLNGNCAVIVHDAPRQLLHLATDAGGVLPAFEVDTPDGRLYCSHPDVLADAADTADRLDEASLAEFILSGTVTPPYSYYERIRAAGHGTIFTVRTDGSRCEHPAARRYFDIAYRGDGNPKEADLVDELASALRSAVRRRTLPLLGRPGVALSGGLDSRVILANCLERERTLAFSSFDEPNLELKTAETIARSLSAPFLPLRRGADYYADHADRGVRISGGMGSFANNHFLGAIPCLTREGVESLLTGCYCDYLFKALPLNRQAHWLTRREALAPYRHEFYFDHFPSSTTLGDRARDRWESRVPLELRKLDTVERVFQVEARRTFPLSYEGDNQQRLVPQRVTGWSPPYVDRDVLDVYCRTPYYFKLNRSLFRKAVVALAPGLRSIPDANTGAPADASAAWEWVRTSQLKLQHRWRRLARSAFSDESWPDWQQYAQRSPGLDALWKRPNPDAQDLFRRVLGPSSMLDDLPAMKRDRPFLFVGLLTVKLWLDQRR